MRVSVGYGPVRLHGFGALLLWLLGHVLRLIVGVVSWSVCRPRATVALLVTGSCLYGLARHPVVVALVGLGLLEVLASWSTFGPTSYRRLVGLRALGAWRSLVVYRRHWQPAMHVAGLEGDDGALPRLVSVTSREQVDVLRVRGLLGQTFADYEVAAPMLAHVFGASDYRLVRGDDRRLSLEFERAPRGRSWDRQPDPGPAEW